MVVTDVEVDTAVVAMIFTVVDVDVGVSETKNQSSYNNIDSEKPYKLMSWSQQPQGTSNSRMLTPMSSSKAGRANCREILNRSASTPQQM